MSCGNGSIPQLNVELTSLRFSEEVSRRNFAEVSEADLILFESILGQEGVCQNPETLQCHNVDCYGMVKGWKYCSPNWYLRKQNFIRHNRFYVNF